jgi:hypothetical protein
MDKKYNYLQFPAASLATIVVIAVITIFTIVSEISGGFKDFLANIGGHHWVGKGILSLIIFGVVWFGSAFKLKEDPETTKKWAIAVLITTVLGMLAIFIFFLDHYF